MVLFAKCLPPPCVSLQTAPVCAAPQGKNFFLKAANGVKSVGERFFGITATREAEQELQRSRKILDRESEMRARQKFAAGMVLIVGFSFWIANLLLKIEGIVIREIGNTVNFFWGLGACLAIGFSLLSIYRSWKFNSLLDKKIQEKDYMGILQLFQEKVSEGEKGHKYIRRRANSAVLEELQTGKLTKLLDQPEEEIASEVKELVAKVQSASRRKMLLSSLTILTSLITLTAAVLGTFFSFGTLPIILYLTATGITCLIWLTSSLISWYQAKQESPQEIVAKLQVQLQVRGQEPS